MIISYQFDNFCSFYGISEYDMKAPAGKVKNRYPDNYTSLDNGYALLKTAVIVGENAGGKSNFIHSLKYLRNLFLQNDFVRAGTSYINSISQSKEEAPVQTFELSVVAGNGKIYDYKLAVTTEGIISESLYRREKAKAKRHMVLDIRYDGEEAGPQTIGLNVTRLALLGDEDATAFVMWMNQCLEMESPEERSERDVMQADDDIRILLSDRYLPIFRMVDDSICDIVVDERHPFTKTIIVRENSEGQRYERELQYDSAGVRDFFAWAIQIYRVVYEDKVVFADEMDRVLNPILSAKVMAFVNGMDHRGQFIFTTHNVLHLDLKLYMKEQIYFITKSPETLISELYSLSDFPEVRYDMARVYDFYLKGILGGTTR